MCGIVGYVGFRPAANVIVDGLQKLEYRGYDSFGVATNNPCLEVYKCEGKISEKGERAWGLHGTIGIGHTRWATHGVPSDRNAHPHLDCSGRIALVHNGIIENYASLRKQLMLEGHDFVSETDTEVIVHLDEDAMFKDVEKIYIVACGTAYHAGLVGRYALEKLARIPVETDIASEFRYRDVLWNPNSVMIVVSQSGETADTLAVLREAKRQGIKVLAVTNVVGSAVSREADRVLYTHAGPEIAVASTKAYSTQLLLMYLLALHLAKVRGTCSQALSLIHISEP